MRRSCLSTRILSTCILPAVFGLASAAVTGCVIPRQPSGLAGLKQLPSDWMTISVNDWRFQALPSANREQLLATREAMRIERSSAYFRFYGRYTDELLKRIDLVQNASSEAFLVSPAVVNAHLTPELFDTADTFDEARADTAMNNNQNLRGLQDDWARFWLLDDPSKLSPYPIMPTSGNP